MRQIEIAQEECYCPVDVTVIPGAGHSPHREAPGATLDAIPEFANAVLRVMKARRDGPRNAIFRDSHFIAARFVSGRAPMSMPPSAASPIFRCRDGPMCRARPTRPTPITKRWRRSPRWCRRASAAMCRRGIRRCATRMRSTTTAISGKSQEILEAVWAAAPQGGRERILLRACIQIATANLRLRMQKPHAAATAARRGARRTQGARHAQPRRRRVCRRLSGRGAGRADQGQTGAAAAWPRPIGWPSGPSAEHETKCMFRRFRLDLIKNMHYCA